LREIKALAGGIALVMYVANWISIGYGKGNNWPAVIFGVTATAVYFTLVIASQREHQRK
jgi:hypothetical protein